MCDTFYAGPGVCSDGLSWFAKNSDRNPEEPQALCVIEHRPFFEATRVGERVLPFPDKGFAFLLSKPSWMAGGEMGINARGVAIGNEAVFSRFAAAKDGILGMEILRAALASSESAEEARDAICGITESLEQGGNGAYKGALRYCNSYIVADPGGSYVVETAGRRWAWRKVEEMAAISNAYSIESDYKRLDAETRKEIAPVDTRSFCTDAADAGRRGVRGPWRSHVEDRLRLRFTKGDERRAAVLEALGSSKGAIGFETVLGALRSHGSFDPSHASSFFSLRHMSSVCMHAGGLLNNATTASMAVAYGGSPGGAARALVWFTGTSYPCLSIYKPILLTHDGFVPLWTGYDYGEGAEAAYAHWERQRAWIVAAKAGALGLDPGFAAKRDAIQRRIAAAAREAAAGGGVEEERRAINAAVAEWYASLGA